MRRFKVYSWTWTATRFDTLIVLSKIEGRAVHHIQTRSLKMNKIKLVTTLFVTAALFVVVAMQAQSDKVLESTNVKQKAASEIKTVPTNIPNRAPIIGSRQGYKMMTDVLDGFGGESESDNYRISASSGGQPSVVGISQSTIYIVKAGFVLASDVKHGDANSDGVVGPGDVVYLINYFFRSGPEPCPMEAGDANCDGIVGPGDIVFLINYLYRNGPPPLC
jgi:hypothetical protein